jgi:hypothetical protein
MSDLKVDIAWTIATIIVLFAVILLAIPGW